MSESSFSSDVLATAEAAAPPPAAEPPPAATKATTTVAPPDVAASVAPETPFSLRDWTGAHLHARGVGPLAMLGLSLALALAAAAGFAFAHLGIGAVLGFAALALSEVARVPAGPAFRDAKDLVQGLSPFVDLLLLAGLVGGTASTGPAVVFLGALLVLVLEAGLPILRAAAGPYRMTEGAALWTRADRLALVLLGALIGRPGTALLLVAVVAALDTWLRVERLGLPAGMKPELRSDLLRHVLREDGSLEPLLRWGSLALAAFLLFLLPVSDFWRF